VSTSKGVDLSHDFTKEELEAMLADNYDNVSPRMLFKVVASHLRALIPPTKGETSCSTATPSSPS
jgi:hypothetical protein